MYSRTYGFPLRSKRCLRSWGNRCAGSIPAAARFLFPFLVYQDRIRIPCTCDRNFCSVTDQTQCQCLGSTIHPSLAMRKARARKTHTYTHTHTHTRARATTTPRRSPGIGVVSELARSASLSQAGYLARLGSAEKAAELGHGSTNL